MTAKSAPPNPPLEVRRLTLEELLAHAYAIELEAMERYAELADQMEVHNNTQVAAVFRKLCEVEEKHARQIAERMTGLEIPEIAPDSYAWPGLEAPETVDYADAHYLMTPWHALKMALSGEQQAFDFFDGVARVAENEEVKALAREFAEDERGHVRMVEDLLAKHPEPPPGWDEDPDLPQSQE